MKTLTKQIIPSLLLTVAAALASTNVNAQSSVTFNCTGAAQTWVVPPCVFSISVVVEGAEGGGSQGGNGAVVTATMAVTPGQTLQINVGCVGACPGTGFNGGGSGYNAVGGGNSPSCGGGGASDIRIAPYGLGNRMIVAAGGGGTGGGTTMNYGGNGGCAAGTVGETQFGVGGGAGTQTAGGGGGTPYGGGSSGASGGLGSGGNGMPDPCYNYGPSGGGGGGYYGGGGGGSDCFASPPLGGAGGGGGSSLTPAGGTCTAATNTGPGVVTINYGVGGGATTASNTGPYCAGQTIQLNAGSGGLAYAWTGPLGFTSATQNPTIPSSTVAMSGTYTVSITFTGGCTATATTAVVVNPVPVTTVNSPTACNGATSTLTGAGATTYVWSTGAVTPSINVTPPVTTTYTVTGTSAGCSSSAVSTVTVIPTPAPVPTNSGPVCSGNTLNLFCPPVAGATYSWTGPAGFTSALQNPSIPSVTAANGGTYSVTYTISGCTSPAGTTNVTVLNTPAPPILGNNGPLCAGQNLILTANNIAGASYAWTGPSGFTAAVRNPPPFASTVASAGTYTCTVTVGGCVSAPATTTVVVNAMPVAPTCPSTSACFGTSVTLTASVSGPVYEWWDAASGGTMLGTGATYVTPPLTSTTTYYVQSNNVGCIGPMTAVTVTVTSAFTVNAGLDDSICAGASSTLNIVSPTGGGYTYTWMPGGMSGPTQIVTPAATTTYTVDVVDAIGCSGSDMITVYVGTPVTATASGVAESCAGACNGTASVVTGGGFGPLTYNWTPGNPTGDGTANITALCNGAYTIVVTDVIGCSATDNTTITGPAAMALVTGFTNATCNAMCDGSATVTAAGGTLPYSYIWSSGQITPAVTGLCAGNYTVTVTDAMSCISTATYTITQPAPVAVDALAPVTICIGQSTTLTGSAMGGTSPYTFDWSAPAFTGPTYTVSPVVTTTYTVSATDAAGCASINTQTVTVTVNPALSVTASSDVSICPGASTTISAVGGGGDNTYTYTWMPGGMTGSSQSVSPAVTTTYTVVLTDGCTTLPAVDSVTVTVLPIPAVLFNSNVLSGCTPLSVNFTDLTTVSGGTAVSWSWDFGAAGTSSAQNPIVVFGTAGVYTVSLTVTSNGGCVSSSTINNMITVNALPVAAFIYDPQPTTIATPTINFHDMSTDATGWYWNFGDSITGTNNFSNMMNPSHAYSDTGSYCVTLIVTNTGSCADTITDCNLYISPEYSFWVPNSFTPDGDGLNDIFMARGEHIEDFTMRIFDRWGELAFFSDDIHRGWNGAKMNFGEIAQQDVFVYIIQIKDKVGMNHQYIGHVTIIK